MSSSSNGRSLTPHLRLNSGTRNPFIDDGTICHSPLDVTAPRAPPLRRPFTPTSPSFSQPSRPATADSQTDHLLPIPQNARTYRPFHSDSRRTSFSSDAGSRSSRSFMLEPYPDGESRPQSRSGSISDDEGLNTQTVAKLFAIVPDGNLIIHPEEIEKDDYLHTPDPKEKDRDCSIFSKRGCLNIGGLTFVILGVLMLFIGYPVLTFVKGLVDPPELQSCETDPMCITVKDIPLLQNIRTGLIDPDTPESAMKIKSAEGDDWELVFSDEFNRPGRTFYPDDDPYLLAVDIWYGVTQDLEWYDPDAVTTKDGVMEIRFDAFQNHNLNYRSGMVQTWNQLCFTGGRLEASVSLPGRGDTSGLWPGFWSMGNLGRPGYAATTEGMWPYSYSDICDAGITPNQSSTDGISFLPGMRLPACTCKGEDHPTPGKSRSSPEIDVLEAAVHPIDGERDPFIIGDVSQSCQLAPFDVWYMPNYDFFEVYDPRITHINNYRGGPYQQAISGLTNLNNDWYDGKAYQVYAYEYEPGAEGYITWFVGQDKTWKLDGRALGPNGNIGQRVIPNEPMSIIMNLGFSDSFTLLNMTGLAPLLPAKMRFDWLRIYQDPKKKSITCDPPGMETTDYIREHPEPYANQNLTSWDKAGYSWPKNTLMHGCS